MPPQIDPSTAPGRSPSAEVPTEGGEHRERPLSRPDAADSLTASQRRSHAIAEVAQAAAAAAAGSPSAGRGPDMPTVPALSDATPVMGLIDLDEVVTTFARLEAAFASEHAVLHAVACKAVPLRPLLHLYAEAGAGCEVASPGELELALAAGFAAEKIVFDSPAKTLGELRRALDLGVSINVDSWEELDRLDALIAERFATSTPASIIGIRINPQSGIGEIGALSTATETSKFGIGLADPGAREALIEAYLARPWLRQVHVHSGSQGIGLGQAAAGVAAAVVLAREVNERIAAHAGESATALSNRAALAARTEPPADTPSEHRRVTRIDIGGGLPVNFTGDEVTPTFDEYRSVLEAEVPDLFDFDVVTEFGRALLAKSGTILTRVETAKTTGGRRIAMTHAGVQVATRTAYAPTDWPLRILPFTSDGSPKLADEVPTDVAGPACFAGDLLAEDRLLPRLDAGDLVAVPETGAYYFSNPFSYNLLPRVPVYGYRASSPITTVRSPTATVAPSTTGVTTPTTAVTSPTTAVTTPTTAVTTPTETMGFAAEPAESAGSGDRLGDDTRVPRGTDMAHRLGVGGIEFLLIRRGQSVADVLSEAGETVLTPL